MHDHGLTTCLLLYRTASSIKTSLILLFVFPGPVPLESTSVHPVANAGISLSTAQSVQLPQPLTVLCTCGKAKLKILTAFAILRGIVTTFTKEGYAWDSGLVIVDMESLVMPPRAGSLCPGSSLKKFLKLRVCLKTPHLYTVIANVRYIKILSQLRGFRVKIAYFFLLHCLAIPRRDLSTQKTIRSRWSSHGHACFLNFFHQ